MTVVASSRKRDVHLFDPISLRSLALPNRIVVSPMCQYSADEGCATDWHLIHWGQLLLSGAGMMTIEATAVSPEGRITPGCLGLYDDATERALADRLARARRQAPPMAVAPHGLPTVLSARAFPRPTGSTAAGRSTTRSRLHVC